MYLYDTQAAFVPGRDHPSPYLYIICSEGLSAYIHSHECRALIHVTRICRGSPSISHLLFADDSFLFSKTTLSKVTTLKHILDTYEAACGQAINYKKSTITYSRNTYAQWKFPQNPSKLKHFCWRMLCNCLPTRFNLHHQGVPSQLDCVLCSNEVEDEMHLFIDCAQAVQCWKEANLWHAVEHHQRQSGSFSNIIFFVLKSLDEVSCAHFIAVLWSI
jgi:hypothetical protein